MLLYSSTVWLKGHKCAFAQPSTCGVPSDSAKSSSVSAIKLCTCKRRYITLHLRTLLGPLAGAISVDIMVDTSCFVLWQNVFAPRYSSETSLLLANAANVRPAQCCFTKLLNPHKNTCIMSFVIIHVYMCICVHSCIKRSACTYVVTIVYYTACGHSWPAADRRMSPTQNLAGVPTSEESLRVRACTFLLQHVHAYSAAHRTHAAIQHGAMAILCNTNRTTDTCLGTRVLM